MISASARIDACSARAHRGKTGERLGSGRESAPAGAAELLKLALGSGQLNLAHGAVASVGYSSSIPAGSPLFQAIRLRRFPRTETRYVKGPDRAFEEPVFGGPDPDPDEPGPGAA